MQSLPFHLNHLILTLVWLMLNADCCSITGKSCGVIFFFFFMIQARGLQFVKILPCTCQEHKKSKLDYRDLYSLSTTLIVTKHKTSNSKSLQHCDRFNQPRFRGDSTFSAQIGLCIVAVIAQVNLPGKGANMSAPPSSAPSSTTEFVPLRSSSSSSSCTRTYSSAEPGQPDAPSSSQSSVPWSQTIRTWNKKIEEKIKTPLHKISVLG